MNFFTNMGSTLNKGWSNVATFFSPQTTRAGASSITKPAVSTPVKNTPVVAQAQQNSLFSNIGSFFKKSGEVAVSLYDKASTGAKNVFVDRKISQTTKPLWEKFFGSVGNITERGIDTLANSISNKLFGGQGQSGTPVDVRPSVSNTAPQTTNGGLLNWLGGLGTPQGSYNIGYQERPIPVNPDGETNVNISSGSSNLMMIAVIGLAVFLIFKKGGK